MWLAQVQPYLATTETGEQARQPPTEEEMAEVAAEMERLFAPGTQFMKQTHAYDELGRLVEKKMMMAGITAFHQSFRYNEYGDPAEETSYDQEGKVQSRAIYEREYDARGNWMTQKVLGQADESSAWRPSIMYRRETSYY